MGTYEVWYRAGASLHWWKLPNVYGKGHSETAAKAIELALKQVGFPFAQAEARLVQQDTSQREYTSESEAIIRGF
jgi:hypothetical protein